MALRDLSQPIKEQSSSTNLKIFSIITIHLLQLLSNFSSQIGFVIIKIKFEIREIVFWHFWIASLNLKRFHAFLNNWMSTVSCVPPKFLQILILTWKFSHTHFFTLIQKKNIICRHVKNDVPSLVWSIRYQHAMMCQFVLQCPILFLPNRLQNPPLIPNHLFQVCSI